MTSRDTYLERMAERLGQWSGQIADLQAKARAAKPELAKGVAVRLTALRQRHADYAGQLSRAHQATAIELRHMRLGTERMAWNFRRAYLQALDHFAR